MAGVPPGGPMEIVFSFDTTGSMYGVLDEVKGRLQDMVQRLQSDIPGIRIAIFAHGDYCDRSVYVTKYIDFTDNVADLCDFVKNVERTGGGDSDECYELVLHEVQHKLSWQPGTQRALVMIGDCNPHEPNYPQNTKKLNWRNEADNLGKMGVRIYSVQCSSHGADAFYKSIADRTGGRYLPLKQFQNIFDFIMAICYRERGDDFLMNYEEEVRGRSSGVVHGDITSLFGGLRDGDKDAGPSAAAGKEPAKVTGVKSLVAPKLSLKKVPSVTRPTTGKVHKPRRVASLYKKFQQKQIPLLRRENVPETNFMLKDCCWSPWQLAVVPVARKPDTGHWRQRSGVKEGLRRQRIFGGKTNVPALYEFAVQLKYRAKLYVVYSKSSKGFSSNTNWESLLLGKSDIIAQIDDVIKNNCSVFVRRLILKNGKLTDKVKSSITRYDYAWKPIKNVRNVHRHVSKSTITISNMIY